MRYTVCMESLLKSDIFFFITSLCVLAITALLLTVLWNVLHVVRRMRKHVDLFYNEIDGILHDVCNFRTTLRENQFGLKPVFDAIRVRADAFAAKAHKKKKPKARKESAEPDTML